MITLKKNEWKINKYTLESSYTNKQLIDSLKSSLNSYNLMEQDEKSTKFVFVENKNSESKNIRYHESKEGGDIHTDAPQYREQPSFVLLYCIEQSIDGGESIIVDGYKLYDHLISLGYSRKILECEYPFEQRPSGNIIWGKIFSFNHNSLKVRYLRSYINSALKKTHSSDLDISLLDDIDAFLNHKANHITFKLEAGDLLWFDNQRFLHGRYAFNDSVQTRRKLLRIWIK